MEVVYQKIKILGCKSIVISDIVEDPDNGYARLVSIYTDDATVTSRAPVLEIQITDTNKASLEIAVPPLEF